MGKFSARGIRRQAEPTKSELIEQYDNRMKSLANAIQQVVQMFSRQIGGLSAQQQELLQHIEKVDYRSLTTMNMLSEKGLLTLEDHSAKAEALRIEDFEVQSKKDDELRKLTPAAGPSKLGQFATVRLWAAYPDTLEVPAIKDVTKDTISMPGPGGETVTSQPKETIPHPNAGQAIDKLSALRSKVQIGSGQLHPAVEQNFVGLNVGESKEFALDMPLEFREFAGQKVKFKVQLFDLKDAPPPPAAPEANAKEAEIQGAPVNP